MGRTGKVFLYRIGGPNEKFRGEGGTIKERDGILREIS